MTVDVCAVKLEKSFLDEKDVREIEKVLHKKSPEEMKEILALVKENLRRQVEDGIDFKFRQMADKVQEEKLFRQLTTDPISKEAIKTYSEAVKRRLNHLVGRNSVDTRARSLRNHFRTKIDEFEAMFRTYENQNFKSLRDIKSGSPEERELYKRVYQHYEAIDPDKLTPQAIEGMLKGKDEIDRLALSLVTYNEYARKTLGKYGVSVKFNNQYVMKRRYDWAALEKMGPEKFAEFMYDKLDIEKTFGEKVTREQALLKLRDIHSEFEKNALERTSVLSSKEFNGSRANSIARKFFYKNADTAYDAFKELSVGGMREQFEKNAMNMANTAIKVSEFGYDAAKVMDNVSKRLHDHYRTKPKAIDQWREARIKQAELELTGQQNHVQGAMTNFANNTRFLMAFGKLGNAVTTAVLDVLDTGRQVFYVNGNLFGGFAEYASAMTKVTAGMNREQRMELANQLGIIYSHMSNAEGMRLANGDLAVNGGRLTQIINEHGGKAMNYATWLPTQTGLSKLSSGLVGAQNFSRLVDKVASGGKLNKFEIDTLKEYGFSKQEMALLGSKLVERTQNWSSTAIFTGSGIRNSLLSLSPERVAKELGVDPHVAGQAVLDLATKYESFVNDFVARGTPTPELATKTLMMKGVDNEVVRAAINLGTQFMDTPLAQFENMMELKDKLVRINAGDRLGLTRDVIGHSIAYIPFGVGAYFAADIAMAAITQRETLIDKYRNGDAETRKRVMLNALGRTSYIPFLFEMLESQTGGGYNKTALDSFGSPALSTGRDILRLMQPQGSGGIGLKDFARRTLPSNAIPVRAMNNYYGRLTGEKAFDDRGGFFGDSF